MPDVKKLRDTIPEARLTDIVSDLSYATSGYRANEGADAVSRFGYDHGNMLIWDKKGKCDLLFEHNGDTLRRNATRALHHFSPTISTELIRGYRLARAAGLLGDGRCNEEAAKFMSTLRGHFSPSEHIENGMGEMAALADLLRKENHKPGGIPLCEPPKQESKSNA